jgi:hypothetical protein
MAQTPEPLPVIAFTVATGEAARQIARYCEASFRRWHPDIPFLCIDDERYRLFSGGQPPVWSGELVSMRALAGWYLSQRARRVIYLDADIFVLAPLDLLVSTAPDDITVWTSDCASFVMGLHEAPRINCGVLASSDPNFWRTWTAAQYGCLLPAIKDFYFDQYSLRLLAQTGAARGRMIDGPPGSPYYNIAIRDQPGEWRVDGDQVFKGEERAMLFHQAGEPQRGIAAAPPALQEHFKALVANEPAVDSRLIDLAAWWAEDGDAFAQTVREAFPTWPTITVESLLAKVYQLAPGLYRTAAPTVWDRHRKLDGTPWRRVWNKEWQAYLYHRAT